MSSLVLELPPGLVEEGLAGEENPAPRQSADFAGSRQAEDCRRRLTFGAFFRAYRWRVLFTYGLFNLENLVNLARPWVLGLAIGDLLTCSYRGLTLLAVQHLAYMLLSASRQMYDTRAFTTIYTELATQLVLEQRGQDVELSRVAARSGLSREMVRFIEHDVPYVLHSLYSVLGALVMLALCDGLLVPLCLLPLLPVYFLSVAHGRRAYVLNNRLNDQLEREVEIIGEGRPEEVREHYGRVAHWRIKLSDRQAFSFVMMNVFVLGLMATALLRCCLVETADVGRIFATFGYVMMFVTGLVNLPALVQQLSRLRDINRRMHWGHSD